MEEAAMPMPMPLTATDNNDIHVPEEIIHSILLRLPSKSLLRCNLVCKSWMCLIRNSAFIDAHLQFNNKNNEAQLILLRRVEKGEEVSSLHLDNSPSFTEHSKLTYPLEAYRQIEARAAAAAAVSTTILPQEDKQAIETNNWDEYMHVVGASNGLICLCPEYLITLIWNPCIRKFVILPPPPSATRDHHFQTEAYGFCYDKHTNDYKVLRILRTWMRGFDEVTSCQVEILSLATGSWKSLDSIGIPEELAMDPVAFKHGENNFSNGALHWLTENGNLFSFDVSTELFGNMEIPKLDPETQSDHSISRYGESIAFFETDYGSSDETFSFKVHMWVMKKYGVPETWTKLLTIPLPTPLNPCAFGEPLYIRKSGEVVLVSKGLFNAETEYIYHSVDPKTGQLKDVQIAGSCYRRFWFTDYFVDSLVLLDHPNAISY